MGLVARRPFFSTTKGRPSVAGVARSGDHATAETTPQRGTPQRGCVVGRAIEKLKQLGPHGRARMNSEYPRQFKCLVWYAHRERGKEDFWYLLTEVVKNPVLWAEYHKALARGLHDDGWKRNKRIELHPRGHIKSNIFTIAYGAWRIIKNPNIRILVGSHRQEDAEGFCAAIRDLLESPEVQWAYPEIRRATNGSKEVCWRDDAFRVQRSSRLKEHTVETTSVTVSRTGRHYNLFLCDDAVTDKNTASATLMKKTVAWYRSSLPLLDPGARAMLVGTRYDWGDLYGLLMRENADDYQVTIRKAIEDGKPIYPLRFTLEAAHYGDPERNQAAKFSLPKLKQELGSWLYSSQYENNPVDPENAAFKREDILELAALRVDRVYNRYQLVDLSGDTDTKSKTAIVDIAVDHELNVVITNIVKKQCSPSEIIRRLSAAQKLPELLRPKRVGAEKAMLEKTIKHFTDKMGVLIPWTYIPGSEAQKSKEHRVLGLQPYVEAHKISILQGCSNKEDLIDELTRFPHAGDMDIADALARFPFVIMRPDKGESLESAEDKHARELREWMERQFGVSLDVETDEPRDLIGAHSVGGTELALALSGVAQATRRVA